MDYLKLKYLKYIVLILFLYILFSIFIRIINIKTKLYFVSLSIFIVLIDQFTKSLMFYNKKLFINKDFLLFKLDFVKNYGAAFNIFSGSRVFLSLISMFF